MNKLREIAPRLSKIKKENPFRVPDNYFDDFSARLAVKLEAEKKALPQPKNTVIRYLKPVLGMAASFALIFMLVYWPLKSFLPNYLAKTNTFIESTTEDDAFRSILERLDETLFFAVLAEPGSVNETAEAGFSDDELMGYLSANISDYELYLQTEN
ncbi:MAG TPA: hypothetical protein ENN90_14315 [Mariniphaga anaerophila]|uniref:Uncharacterized protein n=1 Tax=Mariniphaga anaerophila TaxID=1484053 RepID=A0A831LN39_9BACT|nr:hypothetical protein [Mariniphaga anaerophila]